MENTSGMEFVRSEAINEKPYTKMYKVLPPDEDDYAKCELVDIDTGRYSLDGEVHTIISRTNIKDVRKLIGKVIRITTTVEVVED